MQQEFRKTILLVEDMAIIAMAEANTLKHNGFDVIIAYNGNEAIKLASENSNIDLILMDIDLGKGIDGTEAAQIILKDKEIPIVFLSNHTEKEIVEKTEKITSYGYVVKNSGETVLLASIKMAFKLFDAHHQMLESEMKLLDTDRKFHSLENQIDDVIWTMDMNFKYTYLSPSVEKMNGYTIEEMMKLNLQDYLTEESSQKIIDILAEEITSYLRTKNEENIFTVELEQIKKDGTIFLTEIKARFLLDKENKPMGVIGVTRDITQRLLSEKALRDSEKTLTLALEGAQIGLWDQNFKTGIVYRSDHWATMLGYDPDEMKNDLDFWKSIIHPDDLEITLNAAKKHEQGLTEFYKVQQRLKCKNGKYKWVLNWGKISERDNEGNPIRALGIHIDIDDNIKAEEALRKSEYQFRTLFETTTLGIVYQDSDGKIISANLAAQKILGLTLDQMQGKSSIDPNWKSIHEDGSDFSGNTHPAMVALKTGKVISDVVMGIFHPQKNGHIWIKITAIPLFQNGDKNPYQVYVTFEDITERKRAEETLINGKNKLTSIFKAAPIGIGVTSNRVLLEVNDTMCKMLGYNSDKLIGKSARILYQTQEEYDFVGREKYKQIEQFGTGTVETKWVCKNGKIIDVLLSSTPLNLINVSAGVTFTVLDITERKKTEVALKESQQMIEIILNNIPVRVFWKDTNSNYLGCNLPFALDAGFNSPEEISGKTDFDMGWKNEAELYRKNDLEVMSSGIPRYDYEEPQTRANNEIGWLKTSKIPLKDRNGNIVGLLGTYEDITERKKIEELIKESEANINSLVNNRNESIWSIDRNYNYIFTNNFFKRDYLRVFNIELKKGTNVFGILTPEQKEFWKPKYDKVLAGENLIFEFSTHYENETHYYEVSLSPISSNGQIMGVSAISLDITERKRTEDQLRISEERYVLAQKAANIGSWDWNMITDELSWSELVIPMFGLKPGEFKGTMADFWNRLHPDDILMIEEKIKATIEKNEDYRVEHRVIHPNGTIKWMLETGNVFNNKDGKPYRMLGMVQDITERKLAEERLKQSEENYRRFFEEDLSGVFLSTPQGKIKTCNQAYADLMEYGSISELLNSNPVSHYPESQQRIDFLNLLRKEKKLTNFEGEVVTQKGKRIKTLENIVGVFDEKDNLVEFWGYVNDITDRKRAEQILKNAAMEKEALHRELLHRVKNSFNLIKSLMYLEREKLDDKQASKILENLEMRIGTLSKMYSLLNISGISQKINLDEYLNQITNSLAESYLEDAIRIEIKSSFENIETSPRTASAVGLIVNEILTNSLKYAFPDNKKGNIYVSLKKTNEDAVIEITDDGVGVSNNFNINEAKGMGLQLINMLTQQLSGAVTVESNHGTKFKVVFPLDQ
jgi:PAS domain S-box-containing protein